MEQSLFENENGNFAKPVLGVVPSTKALSIVGSSRNNGEREAEDFGIDKDRKLYMYHGGDWISMETIERMDEHGNILFDKGAY